MHATWDMACKALFICKLLVKGPLQGKYTKWKSVFKNMYSIFQWHFSCTLQKYQIYFLNVLHSREFESYYDTTQMMEDRTRNSWNTTTNKYIFLLLHYAVIVLKNLQRFIYLFSTMILKSNIIYRCRTWGSKVLNNSSEVSRCNI